MEPQRRAALVRATIAEIAVVGGRDITVARIAKRAGMSPALAHHYFGSKDQMLLAAMRQVLTDFGFEARARLARAVTPRARVEAIVQACFSPLNFDAEVVAAWLNFYVQAHRDPETRRLLHIYHARLRSNLVDALHPLTPQAETLAEGAAAMIDGLYVRQALRRDCLTSGASIKLVMDHIEMGLSQ